MSNVSYINQDLEPVVIDGEETGLTVGSLKRFMKIEVELRMAQKLMHKWGELAPDEEAEDFDMTDEEFQKAHEAIDIYTTTAEWLCWQARAAFETPKGFLMFAEDVVGTDARYFLDLATDYWQCNGAEPDPYLLEEFEALVIEELEREARLTRKPKLSIVE